MSAYHRVNRRRFLKGAGGALGAPLMLGAPVMWSQPNARQTVSIVIDPADPIASAPPVRWAAGELQQALAGAGVAASLREHVAQAGAGGLCMVASGPRGGVALPDA